MQVRGEMIDVKSLLPQMADEICVAASMRAIKAQSVA